MSHNKDYKDPRKANGYRRRELFTRVLREESVCWICKGLVDKSLRGVHIYDPITKRMRLHPMSPSLDEVTPVSKGGNPLDRNNVRLAHLSCNEIRGNDDIEKVQQKISKTKQNQNQVRIRHSRDW